MIFFLHITWRSMCFSFFYLYNFRYVNYKYPNKCWSRYWKSLAGFNEFSCPVAALSLPPDPTSSNAIRVSSFSLVFSVFRRRLLHILLIVSIRVFFFLSLSLLSPGLPVPVITWRRNRVTVTGQIDTTEPGRVRSTLVLPPLKRSDWPLTLSCSASNSEKGRPLEQSFDVDMERKFSLFSFLLLFDDYSWYIAWYSLLVRNGGSMPTFSRCRWRGG